MMISKSFNKVRITNDQSGAVFVSDDANVRMFTVFDEAEETAHEAISKLLSEHKFVKTGDVGATISVYERRG